MTKESGPEGGTVEKVAAALDLKISVVLVERPVADSAGPVVSDKDEVIYWAKQVEGQQTIF